MFSCMLVCEKVFKRRLSETEAFFLDFSNGFGYTVGKKKYMREENERENCIGYYAEDDNLFRSVN